MNNVNPVQDDIAIRVRGMTKSFGAQQVFDSVDLDIHRGEILGVVGASGQGKSVLLRCITGLLKYESGVVEINTPYMPQNTPPKAKPSTAPLWGVLFQDGALFSSLSVLQNIQVPMREHYKLSQSIMDELAYMKLGLVGLPADAAHKFPSELSGGMRKRAGLARALALDPGILFLDEPTSGLDPIGAASFDHLIKKLQQTLNLTVYMVTHDLDSIFAVCDRVAVLADKKIVRVGTPGELQARPQHPWIEQYFCGERARHLIASDAPGINAISRTDMA